MYRKKIYGHIIFIDELHHNPNIDAIFDFLKMSQGLTEYIFNYNKIGIFIAGNDKWIERLENPLYRGPIDRFDRMDEIDVDQSYEIVTKRIEEFSNNPKKIKYIEREAIEKIYSGLKEKTPRCLIIETGEVFEKLPENVIVVTSHEVSKKVDFTTIEAVKKKIEGIPIMHRKILTIIDGYKTKGEKIIALRFLSKLYEKKFIEKIMTKETLDEFGLKDTFIIADFETWEIIKKFTTSHKIKGEYGTTNITKSGYILDDTINNLFDTILTSYEIYPEDYLEKIYLPEKREIKFIKDDKADKFKSEEDEKLRYVEEKMKSYKYELGLNYFKRCKEEYYKIFDFLDNPRLKIDPMDVPSNCKRSIFDLFSGYYVYKRDDDDSRLSDDELLQFAVNSFHSEELRNFYSDVKSIERSGRTITRNDANAICRHYILTMKEVLPQIVEEIKYGRKFGLDPQTLSTEDLLVFKEARSLLYQDNITEKNIEDARDKIIKHFEIRMRNLISSCLNIQFGSSWFKDKSPDYVKEGVERALGRRKKYEPDFHQSDNILTYTDQAHLRDLITQNWTQCFCFIFGGKPNKEDDKKQEFVVDWNIIYRKRQDFAHIDSSGGRYVSKAFDNAVLITQWLNRCFEYFLTNNQSVIEKKEGYLDAYFVNPEISKAQPIHLNDALEVFNKIKDKKEMTIRFKDLPPLYTENGRKIFAVYRLLINKECLKVININANNVSFEIHKEK